MLTQAPVSIMAMYWKNGIGLGWADRVPQGFQPQRPVVGILGHAGDSFGLGTPYQHAVLRYDDLFLFGRNGRFFVLAQGFFDLLLDFQQGGI